MEKNKDDQKMDERDVSNEDIGDMNRYLTKSDQNSAVLVVEPNKPNKTEPLLQPVTLKEVIESFSKVLPGKTEMLRLAMAVSISYLVDNKTPLWLMFVGVPSSSKTEVVRMLTFFSDAFFLDTLTENAFVSGSKTPKGQEPQDLLPLLSHKVFIIKDLTTTLSQKEERVKKLLGDLTSIYDDSFAKHSPERGTITYHSFFSILTCVTPQALNKHQQYMSQIGSRFLFYRVPISSNAQIDEGLNRLWSDQDLRGKFETVQRQVSTYVQQVHEKLENKSLALSKETPEVIKQINQLAKFIARARGIVLTRHAEFTNSDGEKISFYEPYETQIEEPFRAAQQLRVLARSLASVSNRKSVSQEDIDLTRKVTLSSMPADRSLLLTIIASEDKSWTAKEIADQLSISHKTASRQLDELCSLSILNKQSQGIGLANLYTIVPHFHSVIYGGEEFMSNSDSSTQTPPLKESKANIQSQSLKTQPENKQLTIEEEIFGEGSEWVDIK